MSDERREMTSSSASSPSGHPKALTNFSIESIIGHSPPKDSKQDKNQPTRQARSNNSTQQRKKLTTHLKRLPDKSQQNSAEVTQQAAEINQQQQRKYRPKNFHCFACKMAFSNNGQLKNHVRIHTGERPFRCSQPNCNKTFTRNEELTRHKLIHTGLRPHSCTVCGKRFGRKDHLKKHVRTHERKKLRKKVYPLSHNSTRQSQLISLQQDLFVPSTIPNSIPISVTGELTRYANTERKTVNPLLCAPQRVDTLRLSDSQAQQIPVMPPLPPPLPVTAFTETATYHPFNTHQRFSQQVTTSITSSSAPAIASETIQQLATDYWYNILGFYRQQSTQLSPPTASLNNLFRKS